MKSRVLIGGIVVATTLLLFGCNRNEVGKVSLGMFTTKDITIDVLQDPVVTGVTCHISSIEADLDLADPSDMSVSCRQTGPITRPMIEQIDKSKNGSVVFKESKSILFKSLKIRRIYDPKTQSLLYLAYSTKAVNGSYKHSLSTVPLWGTQAYQTPEELAQNKNN
jgi:CreA protein